MKLSTSKEDRVINAARAYIREVDNPAPDLLYRSTLRDALREAVDALDGRIRENAGSADGDD